MHGCLIEDGPCDWQILQRRVDGTAELKLRGTWSVLSPLPEDAPLLPEPVVVARVVLEDTADAPTPELDWSEATTHPDGTWEKTLVIPTGGLYRLETGVQRGPIEWALRGDFVHHLGVGDLWVLAGQSNAAGYGRGPVHDPVDLHVHILRNDETWGVATHPLNDTRGNSHPNLEDCNPGHSPFLAFGRTLRRELGYPIGLLQAARGATGMDSWCPVRGAEPPLYNNLMHCVRLAGGRVAGVAWGQGEGDGEFLDLAEAYFGKLDTLISRIREDLGQPELTMLVVQLNRAIMPPDTPDQDRGWTIVREAQRQAALRIPQTAVVSTLDLGLSDMIHFSPAANLRLGHRLARAALGLRHSSKGERFPDIASASGAAGSAEVVMRFTNVRHRLVWEVPPTEEFVVEEGGERVPIVNADLVGADAIRLTLARPLVGTAVVHGDYGRDPATHVYDAILNRPLLGFYGVPIKPTA